MPPKAKGKEKAEPEKPAPVMSMRLQMKLAEEESKKKEAETNKEEDDDSESDPPSKVVSKSSSRARPGKADSKVKKADSSASESEQESPVKPNQRRSTRVAATPVNTEKDATTNGKTKIVSKRGKTSQKVTSEAESSSEEVPPSKPASKLTKTTFKGTKKKVEESSESEEEEEEEEPIRSKANRGKPASARKTAASKKEPKKPQTQTAKKRGKKANVSDKQTSDSDNLEDSSDSDSDSGSGSSSEESGRSNNGETDQKNPKSPQKRIGRPPGAKNKPKVDIITSDEIVPEKTAPDSVNVSVTAPIVSTAGRIKKKGLFLDSEVVDQPTTTVTDTANTVDSSATNLATANKSAVNFTLPADSSQLKLAQLGKGTNTTIPRSTSSVSITSSNSITDLAGASDIITTTIKHSSTTSSSKRIGKKEHVNAELLNSVKINRGEWLRQLEQKINSTEELSAARKSAHHSSSYSSSYTTNNSYSDHSVTTALALWGSLFDDQKTQDSTRVFLEKVRMDVNKSGLKKTDKSAYQSVIEVVDRCDVYAVFDNDMYTHREPSEYTRFMDMSLVLQDEGVNAFNELTVAENTTTNDPSTTTPTTAAVITSPYEIENETVPKPLHIDPNPNDVAQALTWWGMRPDSALLQEIDRKRAVRAEEHQIKVRQAAEKAEQERLKKLELLAKQKADDERRAKWLERTAKKAASVATPATFTNAATTPSTIPDKTESSKQTAPVAPPAPVRAAPPAPIRGPRDRDYSGEATTISSSKPPPSTPAAPPVPAPPAVEPKSIAPGAAGSEAPPVPAPGPPIATTSAVPAPPPVLTVPSSKIHKDRDYSSTADSTATDKPSATTTATNTVTSTTTTTTEPSNKSTDTARIRSKSRDYSDEPSTVPSQRSINPPSSTSVANKAPTSAHTAARPAVKDRDYATLGSKNTTNEDRNRDGSQSYKDTRTSNDSRQRSNSRERGRNVTKDQYGRDVYTKDSYVTEVKREESKDPRREQSKGQGSKRSRSRSAGRNVRANERSIHTATIKSDTTYTTTTKPVNSARSDGNSATKSSSSHNRDVSPVLSRALSTGRDGPKGGPSPPTVKSTIGSVLNTSSTSRDSGNARDVSGSGRKRDGRESSTHVHVSSKVVVPGNTSAARITVATTATNSGGASGQKRQRSPSPTCTTSNKKDAFGRSIPAATTTTTTANPISNTDRASDKHGSSQARSGHSTDKPLTPTSSYRERNVPRPPGTHSSHHRHNQSHNQSQRQREGQSQDTANNQPSGRTVHTNDHNYYNAVNSRQQSNGNRDRNRHY